MVIGAIARCLPALVRIPGLINLLDKINFGTTIAVEKALPKRLNFHHPHNLFSERDPPMIRSKVIANRFPQRSERTGLLTSDCSRN